MITDSYSASCFIENKDGEYHMECDMLSDGKAIRSCYDGDNFVDGLNTIMDSLAQQLMEKPEPEPEPEPTAEDAESRIKHLEETVEKLKQENRELNNIIDDLVDECNYDCKECDNSQSTYHIDDTMQEFIDAINQHYKQPQKPINQFYQWHWPWR